MSDSTVYYNCDTKPHHKYAKRSKAKRLMFGPSKSVVMNVMTRTRYNNKIYSSECQSDSCVLGKDKLPKHNKRSKKRRLRYKSTKFYGFSDKKRENSKCKMSSKNIPPDYPKKLKSREKVKKRSHGLIVKPKLRHASISTLKTTTKSKSMSTVILKYKESKFPWERRGSLLNTKSVSTEEKQNGGVEKKLGILLNASEGKNRHSSKTSRVTFEEDQRTNTNNLLINALELLTKQEESGGENKIPKDTSTPKSSSFVNSEIQTDSERTSVQEKRSLILKLKIMLQEQEGIQNMLNEMNLFLDDLANKAKDTDTGLSQSNQDLSRKSFNSTKSAQPELRRTEDGKDTSEILPKSSNSKIRAQPELRQAENNKDTPESQPTALSEQPFPRIIKSKKTGLKLQIKQPKSSQLIKEEDDETELETITLYSKREIKPYHGMKFSQKLKSLQNEFTIQYDKRSHGYVFNYGRRNKTRKKNIAEQEIPLFRSRSPRGIKITAPLRDPSYPAFKRLSRRSNSPPKLQQLTADLINKDKSRQTCDLLKDWKCAEECKKEIKEPVKTSSPTLCIKQASSGIKTPSSSMITLGNKVSKVVKEFGWKSWDYLNKSPICKLEKKRPSSLPRKQNDHVVPADKEKQKNDDLVKMQKTLKAIVEGKVTPSMMELIINKDTGSILNSDDIIRNIMTSKKQDKAKIIPDEPTQLTPKSRDSSPGSSKPENVEHIPIKSKPGTPVKCGCILKSIASGTLSTIRKAIALGKVTPSIIEKVINKKKGKPFPTKRFFKPMDKKDIATKIKTPAGLDKIMKQIRKAINKGEVTPSEMELLENKEESKKPWNKYDIIAKLGKADGNAEIMKEICNAIHKGTVSPSLIELAISKNYDSLISFKYKPRSRGPLKKSMHKNEILEKMGSRAGQTEILRELTRAMKKRNIPPSLIKLMLDKPSPKASTDIKTSKPCVKLPAKLNDLSAKPNRDAIKEITPSRKDLLVNNSRRLLASATESLKTLKGKKKAKKCPSKMTKLNKGKPPIRGLGSKPYLKSGRKLHDIFSKPSTSRTKPLAISSKKNLKGFIPIEE
ncbi:uncharacterized protein LOC110374992 [Helicoverpa armigera]|uniref:uncharacterized protein LOC110374992 n=1 Tax=Helicoverpa armigera TaxID=29058 RepID=UPI00308374B0